jgi:hypothetical protein
MPPAQIRTTGELMAHIGMKSVTAPRPFLPDTRTFRYGVNEPFFANCALGLFRFVFLFGQ